MSKRSYDQLCGLAAALDVVGERWTLLLVRDLALGPQRYRDLLDGLPGIGTNLLADRLRHLEQHGVVRRTQLPRPAATNVYELTEAGHDLAQAMWPLALWGARFLAFDDPHTHRRPDWLLYALRTRFRPEHAIGVRDTYEFIVDGEPFHVLIADGEIDVRRGRSPVTADAVIDTDLATLMELGLGTLTTEQAVRRKRATVAGDAGALRRMALILGAGGPADRPRRPVRAR